MKRILFATIAVFCCAATMQAQPLNPGDKCPNFEFNVLLNNKVTKTHLSDYKGKMLLLDFWSTNCGPCIAAFPKMESLQKQFGDKVVILPVIEMVKYDEKAKEYVAKFWANNKITKTVSLPTAIVDTANVIRNCFPHKGVPHEVWIDAEGVVRGITSAAYVTPENIQKLVNREKVDWAVYRENQDFNASNALLIPVDNGAGMPEKLFYTSLTSYLPTGQQNMLTVDSTDKYRKYLYMNIPAVRFYKLMLYMTQQRSFMWNNRVVLEVKDKTAYQFDRKAMPLEEWNRKNTYCYEAVLPLNSTLQDFYANMGQDINRFLGLNGRIEKRVVACYVLKRTSNDDKLFQSGTKEVIYDMDEFHNTSAPAGHTNIIHSFPDLMMSINRLDESPIVLDETGYNGPVNIPIIHTAPDGKVFVTSMSDVEGMRKQLVKFGLDFVPENRELEVFVVTENNFKK